MAKRLFDSQAEELVANSFAADRLKEHDSISADMDTAVQYADGIMLADTEGMLQDSYPMRQKGSAQMRIKAAGLPIVKRFLDDMATAYSNGVVRRLVGPAGEVDTDCTKEYNDALEEIGYDQTMAQLDRYLVLFKCAGLLFQIENGQLDPVVYAPQLIHPVAPKDLAFNPANAASYRGFVIDNRISSRSSDRSNITKKTYTLIVPGGIVVFKGKTPNDLQEIIEEIPHSFEWDQVLIDDDGKPNAALVRQPLQMFTVWHEQKPASTLIPLNIPALFTSNRLLNVQWSVLHDVFRFQAGATPVKKVINPDAEGVNSPIGVHYPQLMRAGETEDFTYAVANNDYEALIAFLSNYSKQAAIMERMTAADLDPEASAPESGFAKLVASLPKIEGRDQRVKWLAIQERRSYPQLASILIYLGKLKDSARGLKLQIQFEAPKIPKSIEERKSEDEHDFKWGLKTPAQVYAERYGCSEEDAKKKIIENLEQIAEIQQAAIPEGMEMGANGRPQPEGTNEINRKQQRGFMGKLVGKEK